MNIHAILYIFNILSKLYYTNKNV